MDNTFYQDQRKINKIVFKDILKNFVKFLNKYGLIGQFKYGNKIIYDNDFNIPKFLKKLLNRNFAGLKCEKPILGFLNKNLKRNDLNSLKEEKIN